MNKKLEDIASIATGVYEKGSPTGDTFYLQAKHFDEYGKFRQDSLLVPEVDLDERLERHLLEDGDVLLIAKGENNRACLYQEEIGKAVASSTFFVIRLTEGKVIPEFLHWLLNTAYMQAVLSSLSRGTHISSISKKILSKMEIQIPPLEQQKKVLRMQSLWEKERSLTSELIELKEKYYETLLLNLANPKVEKNA